MAYVEFRKEFTEELKEQFERNGYRVDISTCNYDKVNQKVDGVVFRLDNSNIAPTIHMNEMYERWRGGGMSVRELAENVGITVKEEYSKIKELDLSGEKLTPEYVKEHAYLSVANTEMNAEWLKSLPHEEIKGTDLSAFIKVNVGENATFTLTNEHAAHLQMTKSELIEAARENTLEQEFSVRSMEDVLKDLIPEELVEEMRLFPEGEFPNMVVISNETGFEGANAILSKDTLDEACKELGTTNITVIPSSRHELIAINAEAVGISVDELRDIVEEMNGTEISLADQLSDNVYQYDGESHKLEMWEQEMAHGQEVTIGFESQGMNVEA